jgi:uncharacterized protein YbjT (DUF2867 family)
MSKKSTEQASAPAGTRILVVGANGLVGSAFVQQWQSSNPGGELHILLRTESFAPPGVSVHVAAPEDWPDTIAAVAPQVVFCALGTTIRKAGSKQAFRAVDLDLVASVAQAAKAAGARQFILISSTMANASASGFYLRTKGQAEAAVEAQHFDRLDIIRPGLLRGDRSEFRAGERLAILLSPLLDRLLHGNMRKYRSVHVDTVAKTALSLVNAAASGNSIHETLA